MATAKDRAASALEAWKNKHSVGGAATVATANSAQVPHANAANNAAAAAPVLSERMTAAHNKAAGALDDWKARHSVSAEEIGTGFNSWIQEYNSMADRLNQEYSVRQGAYQTADSFGKYRRETETGIGSMQDRANSYRTYFENNGEMYDAEQLKSAMLTLDEIIKSLDGVKTNLGSEADYWAQFADEAAYNQYQNVLSWQDLPGSADYEEKSAYDAAANKTEQKMNILATMLSGDSGGIVYDDPGYKDLLLAYINGDENAGAIIQNNDANMYSAGSGALGAVYAYAAEGDQESQQMTGDEIKLFNYLYNTKGQEAAYEYYAYLKSDLYRRNREADQQNWAGYAAEDPFGSSVFSTIMSPAKGVSYLMQGADYLGDGQIDQNAPYNKFAYIPSTIRGEVSQTIENSGKWGSVGSFAYNTGMSMADFLFNTAISGGFAGGGALSQNIALGIMGTGAAADTVISLKDQGISDDRAFILGTVAGAAEVVTEKVSLEALLKPDLSKGAMRYIVKNILAEGSEEGASDAINWIADGLYDVVTSQDESEWKRTIAAYMADGMTESEATGKAFGDRAKELGLDMLGGALSGGVMAGTGVGIDYAGNKIASMQQAPTQAAQAPETMPVAPNAQATQTQAPIAPAQPAAPTAQEVTTLAPTAQEITTQLVQAGVEPTEAESLGSSMAALMNGEEISGNKAGAISENEVAVSILENTTGQQINTDAPLSEVKAAIRSLASPAETQTAAPAGVDTALEERAAAAAETAMQPSAIDERTEQTAVEDFADTMEKAGAAAMRGMRVKGQSAADYVGEMMRFYNAGRSGSEFSPDAQRVTLNPEQAEAAFIAGQADAQNAVGTVSAGDRVIPTGKAIDLSKYDTGVIQAAINKSAMDGWRTNKAKSQRIKRAIWEATGATDEEITAIISRIGKDNKYKADSSVEVHAASGYTEVNNSLSGLGSELKSRMQVKKGGLVYTVRYDSGDGKYYVSIDRDNDALNGYITDARANIYRGGPFNSREDAVQEILNIARNNRLTEEKENDRNIVESDDAAARASEKERIKRRVMKKYGLTEDEAWAVTEYKTAEAYKVNAKLREGADLSPLQKKLADNLDSALKKLPLHEGTHYRTVSFDDVFDPEGEYNDFLSKHGDGDVVRYKAFTSTSSKPSGHPLADGTQFGITLEIVGASGRDLDGFGNNFESEVLFPRDSNFAITAVGTDKDGRPYIKMTEVGEHGELREIQGGVRLHSEERSDVLQPVQPAEEVHSAVPEVPERDSGRRAGTEEPLQGVQAEVSEPATPQRRMAADIMRSIKRGTAFNSARLFEIADKAYGGTMAEGAYTVKDAYDGMELAVNLYLVDLAKTKKANTGDIKTANSYIASMQELLSKLPTQTKRTKEQEDFQQYSTPPSIAYLAAWAANITGSDVILEPSAGIGGLALWGKAWGATVYANELSKRRLAFLNQLGLDKTFNLNAEQIDNLLPDTIKPTVVVMNPPFSATAGRVSTNKTANAKRHIEQALDRLEDGGRLVAIVGNGMADNSPSFKSWWNELRKTYNVRANVGIDGENYRKYGTTFDIQLVVIDKTGPGTDPTITGTYKNLTDIPKALEGVRNERKAVVRDGNDVAVRSGYTAHIAGSPEAGHPAGVSPEVLGGHRGGRNGAVTSYGKGRPEDNRVGGRSEGDGTAGSEREGGTDGRGMGGRDGGTGVVLSGHSGGNPQSAQVNENPDSVYAAYAPSKVHIKGAKKHPANLVESAAMSAVEPPEAKYTPALPERIAKDGILSDAQLENVVYAGQAHSQKLPNGQRKGFFIGDGTGVGKGRQLSGIIMDNFLQGRNKAVWVSKNAPLINDAKRDWKDLGGNPDVIFDASKPQLIKTGIQQGEGIAFTAYSTLGHSTDERLKMLSDWLGKDFDGVIALDEAHEMANSIPVKKSRGKSKPAKKALAGIALQNAFPNARIVYASATGATDITQYGYLERLGLWGKGTAFNNLVDFASKIGNGGLAAMELVARDMKAMGVYMARSISYDDVQYDTIEHSLTPMQREIYDTMSRAWQKVLQNVNDALDITGGKNNGIARSAAYSALFSGQQRFYNQILTSMSMPSVIADIEKELAAGRSIVIQLTSTNEAQANRAIAKNAEDGGDLDDLDLTPSEMLKEFLLKSFPVTLYEEYEDEYGNIRTRPVLDENEQPVQDKRAVRLRDALIEELGRMKVPDGPLEMLFDAFGADNVAEVTGRSRRVVQKKDENGHMRRVIEKRSKLSGIADTDAFQSGKKRILVFSQAGGTGRSYHADLRAKNQQQRVHYLLQAGWSASEAVQGFGRTHRSNQAVAPIVRLVTTNAMGQKRFTSTIARRLDQLGALTKGQRQAGSGVFGEKDNLENPIAEDALSIFYKGADPDILRKLGLYEKLYDRDGKLNDSADALRNVSMFLNRILALEIDEQNEVFNEFYSIFSNMMDAAIANGTVDMGLENYKADKIEVVDENVVRKDDSGADTKYVQMKTYRKPELISYDKLKNLHADFEGLYRTEDGSVRAVYRISDKTDPRTGEVQKQYRLESPVKGKGSTYIEKTLRVKTTAVEKSEWRKSWESETAKAPEYVENTLHMLTGTLLPIWDRLPTSSTRVMRVLSSDGRQYLGRIIRADQIDGVLRGLGASRTKETYTGKQVMDAVLKDGKRVLLLHNKTRLIRSRVSGELRIEIKGDNSWYIARQYTGVITEKISYVERYFIPTGERGISIINDLIRTNPVVDVMDGGENVQYSKDVTNDGMPHPERWTAKRVGSSDTAPKPVSDIIAQIRHDFGLNVTYGHVHGTGVRGQFSPRDKGIRSRIANDLPTVCHELGHALDDRFSILGGDLTKEMHAELEKALGDLSAGYKEDQYDSEGLAEFLRQFLQNRETAAIDYPAFTKYLLGKLDGKTLATLQQLADDVNAYYSLDADSAESSVRLREEGGPDLRTHGEKIRQMGDEFYQAWIDANHGIKLFDEATGSSVYKLAINSAYSDAISGRIITSDLTDANGQYVGPGLKTALHGINTRNKKEYKAFSEYLVVRHGPEYLAEEKRVFADDRKNSTAWMQRRQMELEAEYPEFEAAAKRVYQFLADLNKAWGVDTQVIGADQLAGWQQRWPNYVPFYRAMPKEGRQRSGKVGAKRGFANQTSPHKRAKGSGLDIISTVDNIIDQIVLLVNVGVRNNVMYQLRNAAIQDEANATLMEKIPTPMVPKSFDMTDVKADLAGKIKDSDLEADDKIMADKIISSLSDVMLQFSRGKAHGNVVTVMVNGNPEFWKINDSLLLESITSLSGKKLSGVLDGLAIFSRFMTANITGNNVVWSIFSNAPRDLMTLFTYSKNKNPVKLFSAMGSAYINKINGDKSVDPLYAEYLAMGGGHTSAYSADTDLAKKARKKLSGKQISANPIEWISFAGDTIEQGPRFATYKLMRKAGLSPQEAFYEAMDVTVNFRRGGRVSRDLNKAVPFFNASVQGLDKFQRWITAKDIPIDGRKKAARIRAATYFASSAALAAIFYALNNGDDDREKDYQQLSNYTKNSYWCIPIGDGKYLTIPKPRELAVLTSLMETGAEYFVGKNDHAFDEFYDYAVDNFLPSVASDAAKGDVAGAIGSLGIIGVGSYMVANRDFLGKPIVSAGMQYYESKDQYTDRTSKIAYELGQAFNMSPVMIDYFFQQVLGGWWKYQKALWPIGGENTDLSLGVKNSYVKDNQYSTDLVNWMYDQADGSAKAKKSDPKNMDKAITAKMDSSMTEFYSRFYGLVKDNSETDRNRAARQVVLDMITEYRKSSESGETTRVQDAVYAVVRVTGETSYMPSVMNTFVKDGDDVKHTLSGVQYLEYQTNYNRLYWEYAEAYITTGMSTSEKAATLAAAKEAANEGATNAVLSQIGAPKTTYAEKYAGISTDDVIEYKAKVTSETDGSPKQEEIVSIIDAMISEGLTYDEAYLLFHAAYDSDKNNPWKKYAP